MAGIDFEQALRDFLDYHRSVRRGERLRRLAEGLGHAETHFLEDVWWPAFRNFRGLHPEYEVTDFDGRSRFLDFAYLSGETRLAIEVDGYGPHVTGLSRWQFINQLRRQNHLVLDGWAVLRFSYDEIIEEPRRCQQVLQQFMGRWVTREELADLGVYEREVVQWALRVHRPFTPGQVRAHLQVGRYVASRILRDLTRQGWLEPASGRQRIRSYRLNPRRFLL